MCPRSNPPLLLLESPYHALRPMEGGKQQLKNKGRKLGSALVWVLEGGATEADRNIVEQRPGGLSLIVILPRVADLANDPTILHLVEGCRPQGILPFHERLAERELAQVLKRPPDDLGAWLKVRMIELEPAARVGETIQSQRIEEARCIAHDLRLHTRAAWLDRLRERSK